MPDEFARLDAVAQAELVRAGTVTPRQLVDAAIERIERLNGRLNAVILPAFDRARRLADEQTERLSKRRDDLPPFFGVPFLMKDLGGLEKDAPAHLGMKFLKDAQWVEPEDSHLATRLRAAGFISLGRTNTPELGLLPTTEPLAYGATRNPWSLEHSAGGSSGGSASAVAAGLVAAAHASDGGGSIRIPAAHCGLVGLKPTRGRSSFGPAVGERWAGFSCELAVTRSVRDTAGILDAAAGAMPGDPYSAAPPARPYVSEVGAAAGSLRIGFVDEATRAGMILDPECVAAVQGAARVLRELGHRVEQSHPECLGDEEAVRAYVTIVASSIARAFDIAENKIERSIGDGDVEPVTATIAAMGRQVAAPQYIAAVDYVHRYGRRMAAWWSEGFDLLLTPTTGAPPPRIGDLVCPVDNPLQGFIRAAPFGMYTMAFNQTGQPAISLPLHWTAEGLPVGVQLVAPYGREDMLLRVAAQLEDAQPWRDRWPRIAAGE
jgi:amidase